VIFAGMITYDTCSARLHFGFGSNIKPHREHHKHNRKFPAHASLQMRPFDVNLMTFVGTMHTIIDLRRGETHNGIGAQSLSSLCAPQNATQRPLCEK
jgi:hypothetical protein